MALCITLLFGHLTKRIFFGQLRPLEVEHLMEKSRETVMELCLAMTIFSHASPPLEFDTRLIALLTALLFVKVFHWLSQDRVDFIEQSPAVSIGTHLRITTLLSILLAVDVMALYVAVLKVLEQDHSIHLLFAFEYVILASTVVSTFLKYALHMIDMRMEGRWDSKGLCVFYLELVTDLFHLLVYLLFFMVIFFKHGLALHIVRDLYLTFKNFRRRINDFIRYRRVTANMNERFPDATPEELDRSDRICIICREEMTVAKRLPCSHLFHLHCLRSWLERQQSCPTCRTPVDQAPAPAPSPPPVAPAPPVPAAAAAPEGAIPPNLFGGPGVVPPAPQMMGAVPPIVQPPHVAPVPHLHPHHHLAHGLPMYNPFAAMPGMRPTQPAGAPFAAFPQFPPFMLPPPFLFAPPHQLHHPPPQQQQPQQQALNNEHFSLLQQQIEYLQNQIQQLHLQIQGPPSAPPVMQTADTLPPPSIDHGTAPVPPPPAHPPLSSDQEKTPSDGELSPVTQPVDDVLRDRSPSQMEGVVRANDRSDDPQEQIRRRRLERFSGKVDDKSV
eukprot:CAMPEP_0184675336 /NCGR_PEP_ID=MMETSP0308-20130426/87735_1 /TAXON_ID=38269 /ORGANISM="Gloeochaete witrockiana, Strain SAG 46.84" /LENGTH=554 /DNA_ID=CAMNT_0027123033 /DNA_START=159 /DNA_END=1823 /DNA_ORIENTATION=-